MRRDSGGRAAANRGGNYCSESRNAMAERRARRGGEEWGPSINDVRIDRKWGGVKNCPILLMTWTGMSREMCLGKISNVIYGWSLRGISWTVGRTDGRTGDAVKKIQAPEGTMMVGQL